jgi:hypothetical protein
MIRRCGCANARSYGISRLAKAQRICIAQYRSDPWKPAAIKREGRKKQRILLEICVLPLQSQRFEEASVLGLR